MATTAMPMSADQVQKKMTANSTAWQTATPQIQNLLHQENLDLAKQTGQSYNSEAGTYSTPTPPTPTPATTTGSGGVIPQAVNSGGGGGPVNADGSPYVWKGAPSGGGGGGGGTTATPQPWQGAPQPWQGYPPTDYAALAAARTAASLAQKRTTAEAQKGSLDRSFARDNQITNDNRTLENGQINRTLNPFSGKTAYDKGIIGRERTLADESKSNNLAAQKSNIDQLLSDYENATAQEQMKIADELQRADRSYQLNLAQFQEQQNNNQFSQGMQTKQFEYGVGRDSDKTQYDRGRDSKSDAISADNTAYNRSKYDSETAYNHGQDSISNNRNAANDAAANTGYYNPSGMNASQINQEIAKNSAAYGNASPEVQKQLHDQNIYLNSLLGKSDSTGSGDYTGGNPNGIVGYRNVAGQTLDLNNAKDMATLTGYMPDGRGGYVPTNAKQQQDLSNAWHESEQLGYVTRSLSSLTGIPAGTQTQAAKNQASQNAISARNAANSETSTANSNQNAKDRLTWDKDPNNPDNKLKESTITKNNSAASVVNPKTSTDNHALIAKDIGSATDAAEANALIEANRNNLTDADYKDLKKQVIDKF